MKTQMRNEIDKFKNFLTEEIENNFNTQNSDKTELQANVERELIKFFEGLGQEYNIDYQWVVNRFNDSITENFIKYICIELIKTKKNKNQ